MGNMGETNLSRRTRDESESPARSARRDAKSELAQVHAHHALNIANRTRARELASSRYGHHRSHSCRSERSGVRVDLIDAPPAALARPSLRFPPRFLAERSGVRVDLIDAAAAAL